jgi:uncharacterized protein (TIGR00251 family)
LKEFSVPRVDSHDGHVRFNVRVQPRSSGSEISGTHGDAIKIRLAAPPVDDAANNELIALVAKQLNVAKSAVRIVRGHKSRNKVIEVAGVTAAEIEALVP